MKERGKLLNNTIVKTVMSNFGLYKALDKVGIDYEKTKVGDKYVYENMVTNGHRIGGEQSGHIIFTKYATTGDGILTSIELMEAMLDNKQTLSRLCAPVVTYPQVLRNVRVADKKAHGAKLGLYGGHHGLHLGSLCHIGPVDHSAVTGGLQLCFKLGRLVLTLNVVYAYGVALPGHAAGNGPAYAAGCAGYKGDFFHNFHLLFAILPQCAEFLQRV